MNPSSWLNLNTLIVVILTLVGAICVSLLLYIGIRLILTLIDSNYLRGLVWRSKEIPAGKRVLLVIAHPDDECMFFGPVLVTLAKKPDTKLSVLCLSTGNHEGLGPIRKKELWNSCDKLGVPQGNITLIDSDHFKDNPDRFWRPADIGLTLMQSIIGNDIDTVITFDDQGVSGHLNHISIRHCIDEMMRKRQIPPDCRVYSLETVGWFRKYILGPFDVFISYLTSEFMYVADEEGKQKIIAAMKAHHSQFVWYRRLYMLLSHYVHVNTFKELPHPVITDGSDLSSMFSKSKGLPFFRTHPKPKCEEKTD